MEGVSGKTIRSLRASGISGTKWPCRNLLFHVFIPGSTFYQPDCLLNDMDNIHTANGNADTSDKHVGVITAEGDSQNLNFDAQRSSPPRVTVETSKETTASAETPKSVSPSTQPSPSPAPDRPEDQNNNNHRGCNLANSAGGHPSATPSPPAPPSLPKVQ